MSSTATEPTAPTLSGGFKPKAPDGGFRLPDSARIREHLTPSVVVTGLLFIVLFIQPFGLLLRDWWTMPEAGHGLLLGPVAVWFAWKAGVRKDATGNVALGLLILGLAVALRFASGLAAELFTMRASMVMAGVGLVVYFKGTRQALHWWLPILLFSLSV